MNIDNISFIQNFKNLYSYWKILILYLSITGIVALAFEPQIILYNRLIFIIFLSIAIFFGNIIPKKKSIIHLIAAYAFLGIIYKETATIHSIFFKPVDSFLMKIDEYLFGFQPSLEFSAIFNQFWFSELMFFGYFSYYLTPLIVIFSLRKQKNDKITEFGSILITSFVIYYIIFILIPAVGPQFFWKYPENFIEAQGIFGKIVKYIQLKGEAPTAAFPSSHVGISVIILLWLFANNRKLMFCILPLTTILIFSTIYIKAHYAIDVFIGLLSGCIIYLIINGYYKRS